jgi:hypothetical protein
MVNWYYKGKREKGGFIEGQEGKRLPHVKQRMIWEDSLFFIY